MADVWPVWGGGGYPSWSIQRGDPLPCSLPRGSTSMFTSGGGGYPSWSIQRGRPTSVFTSEGVHFCVHFWGVPCDLSHNALICPSASWAKFTWDPPNPTPTPVGQIDRQTRVKTLPSRTTWRAVKICTVRTAPYGVRNM